jgi:hypothetical protein
MVSTQVDQMRSYDIVLPLTWESFRLIDTVCDARNASDTDFFATLQFQSRSRCCSTSIRTWNESRTTVYHRWRPVTIALTVTKCLPCFYTASVSFASSNSFDLKPSQQLRPNLCHASLPLRSALRFFWRPFTLAFSVVIRNTGLSFTIMFTRSTRSQHSDCDPRFAELLCRFL